MTIKRMISDIGEKTEIWRQVAVEMLKPFLTPYGLTILTLLLAMYLLLPWPFMWIWNYAVVAAISIANPIGYWEAFALVVLLAFLKPGNSKSSN